MMNFDKFVDEVKSNIKDYLPNEYADSHTEINKVTKLNEQYTGLVVQKEGQQLVPNINLEHYFDELQSGVPMDRVMEKIAEGVQYAEPPIDLGIFSDYEHAKEALFIRLCNVEANKELLQTVPHTIVEDLAITYHLMAIRDEDGIGSTIVNNNLLEMLKVSKEQLHQDAVSNSPEILPEVFEPMDNIMKRMLTEQMREDGMSPDEIDMVLEDMSVNQENPMMVLTNENGVGGAAALFYPEVMEKIAEKMKGNYFVLPSSIHEVILLPDDGKMNFRELKEMVTDINASQVLPNERLADQVYHYDAEDKVFEKAASFEERMEQKMQERSSGKQKESVLQKLDEKKKEFMEHGMNRPISHKNPEMSF